MDTLGIALEDTPPAGWSRTTERCSFCRYVALARTGDAFYTTPEDILCPLGAFHLGLQQRDSAVVEAMVARVVQWYYTDEASARRYLETAAHLPDDAGNRIFLYFKDLALYPPDIVIVAGKPDEIMAAVRDYVLATSGERMVVHMGGIAATCGEVGALPLITQTPNVSLGCSGTRSAGKLPADELLLGIPRACFNYFEITKNVL